MRKKQSNVTKMAVRVSGFPDPANKIVFWIRANDQRAFCGGISDGVEITFDDETAGGLMDINGLLAVADAIRKQRKEKP